MPRRGENIYKRKDGRWEGRYIADRKPDGKAVYRSIYGTSYAQVRERLVAKRQETHKRQIGSCKLTVNELLALWQAENSQIKATSRERYRALIELHIQPELGARKVRELNEEVLDAFVRKKLKSGRLDGRGGLAPKTVRDICIVMKSALKLAKRKYRYSGDGGINAPAIRQKQVEFFSQLESQRITAAVLKKLDRSSLGYLLCLETGLRLGEVCALRWSDIDLAEGVLRVQRTVYRINYGKLIRKFTHFCEKTRMNIEGLSQTTLSKFLGHGWIRNFGDLYELEKYRDEFLQTPGFGEKSFERLLASIEKSRHCTLARFIAGLGIPMVGRHAGRDLDRYFGGSWEAFEQAIQDGFDFTQLHDFGETMNNNIYLRPRDIHPGQRPLVLCRGNALLSDRMEYPQHRSD